jgi:Fic family protein
LNGDTVIYGRADSIKETLDYDFAQEKKFNYKGLSKREIVEQLAKFTSGIWQIHPFGEGNTRTTAVFIIKYLYTLGFKTTNDMFEKNAKYFRNALVRANYQNLANDIPYTMEFLNKFFGNLLLGEKNLLDNREMQIKGKVESKEKIEKSKEKSKEKIMRFISENPQITTNQLAEFANLSIAGVEKNLRQLKEQNLIRRVGPDKGGHWEVIKK